MARIPKGLPADRTLSSISEPAPCRSVGRGRVQIQKSPAGEGQGCGQSSGVIKLLLFVCPHSASRSIPDLGSGASAPSPSPELDELGVLGGAARIGARLSFLRPGPHVAFDFQLGPATHPGLNNLHRPLQ